MNPMQSMSMMMAGIQPGGGQVNSFPMNSRYHGINTATITTPGGKTHIYLQRRFVPAPERFALLQEHLVTQGDRLDNITATYLGEPELFWRVCDANRAMQPAKLTATIGSRLKITLPADIPGMPNA
jgi:hypothetical protein